MKKINTYIIEKFKISKDIKVDNTLKKDFNPVNYQLIIAYDKDTQLWLERNFKEVQVYFYDKDIIAYTLPDEIAEEIDTNISKVEFYEIPGYYKNFETFELDIDNGDLKLDDLYYI